jgi:HrpA-like RNA helicase
VFLTGQDEIETMTQQIRQIVQHEESLSHSFRPVIKMIPLPLYASLQTFGQQKVFAPTKPGTRKVILSTNIAETSITIPGIRYVIDSCRVKAK